jgi:hypothetical protein
MKSAAYPLPTRDLSTEEAGDFDGNSMGVRAQPGVGCELARNHRSNSRGQRKQISLNVSITNAVRRFVEQVYIPQKYENADWRKATGHEAEYLFRRSILPEIGEFRCRDLKAEHLRAQV